MLDQKNKQQSMWQYNLNFLQIALKSDFNLKKKIDKNKQFKETKLKWPLGKVDAQPHWQLKHKGTFLFFTQL